MQKKRKLKQSQEDSNSVQAYGLAIKESDTQNVKKIFENISSYSINSSNNINSFSHQLVSNSQCLSSLLTSEDRYKEKPIFSNVTMLADVTQHGLSSTHCSPLIEINESVTSLKQLNHENLNESTLENFNDSLLSLDDSSSDESGSILLQALKLWILKGDNIPKAIPMKDVNGSSRILDLTITKDQDLRLRKALKLLIFNNDCLPQPIIPIGPGFQAEIPKWKGSINREEVCDCVGDSEDSRWLGTQIWPPIEGTSRGKILTEVGKGRPNSCTCISPKSIDCVKHHVNEACLRLQYEIGLAFWDWKFDEMGEAVSKSWTPKEQQIFKSLVRNNPLASGTNFWELALKHFPSKCQKSLMSYYFNVSIPRRMSLQTRSSPDEVDSDEDHFSA
ncbi:hypothetical protein FNV43_RR10420 [Rhamnella rubrinervis]|uniref:Myb-like domain-containing protein n=1 Tax=Rhamnella rubrinervis TaxID=2594499 RepID=A0A8K0MKR6_9ROSA|nr:hypothetical protein FNV43_RR10420 [Rhamnella rubrinervis]